MTDTIIIDPATPEERLEQYVEEYAEGMDLSDVPSTIDEENRFLLVEKNVRGSEPPYWLTTHADPDKAGGYHTGQEYAEDWEIVCGVDLMTGTVYDGYVSSVTWTAREDED